MNLFDPQDQDTEKALGMAVRYLGTRPRSRLEMKTYLERKGWDQSTISTVISRLERYHYLDDEMFARLFIENRERTNPKSKLALTFELRQKGISSKILDTLLDDYNDTQMACRALMTKQQRWQHLEPDVQRQKTLNYLRYRGFGYDVCRSAWEEFVIESARLSSHIKNK